MNFAERFKIARSCSGLTQAEVAIRAGITVKTISRIERGLIDASSDCGRIAAACGVSDIWLAEGVGGMLEVTERPAGVIAGNGQIAGDLALGAATLQDFTGGGVVNAPACHLGASRHDIDATESVARNDGTLLDYFQQFPGWEGFLGAMGEAFMREYSDRTDADAAHQAGMMAALSVALAPSLSHVLSDVQRQRLMRGTVTTADFVTGQVTVSVSGLKHCSSGRYLLIPEATDGN